LFHLKKYFWINTKIRLSLSSLLINRYHNYHFINCFKLSIQFSLRASLIPGKYKCHFWIVDCMFVKGENIDLTRFNCNWIFLVLNDILKKYWNLRPPPLFHTNVFVLFYYARIIQLKLDMWMMYSLSKENCKKMCYSTMIDIQSNVLNN